MAEQEIFNSVLPNALPPSSTTPPAPPPRRNSEDVLPTCMPSQVDVKQDALMPFSSSEHEAGSPPYVPLREAAAAPPAERKFEWNKRKCTGNALHEAILRGDLEETRRYLDGAQAEAVVQSRFHYETVFKGKRQEGSGESIHIAASRGHIEIVKLLLKRGSRLDAYVTRDGDNHYDVLHAAVFAEGRKGNLEMVRFLLENGAPFTSNIDGKTVLHIAYQTGSLSLIEIIQEESSNRSRDEKIEAVRDRNGMTPLEVGFRFSNMSFEELTGTAPFTAESMRVFLANEPRCIPTFLKRALASPSINNDGLALVQKFELDMAFASQLITKCPEVADEFLLATSGPPECINPGWHPVPTRMATAVFMSSAYGGTFRRLLNSPPDYFSFYERENVWAFDAEKFQPPKWHSRLASMEPPCVGVEVSVCHIHSMMCAEVFAAISNTEDLELFRSRTIGGLIERLWWQGAYRYDFLQVCLNFWALVLLTVGVLIPECIHVGDDFAGARGVVGILNEIMEYFGYKQLRSQDLSYFRFSNMIDIGILLNMIALFFREFMPDQLTLTMRAGVICILWFRLLGFFRCSELMAVVLMPIMRSINSVVPALFITCVTFLALFEASFVFSGGEIMTAWFNQFGLLFAGNYPVRRDDMLQMELLLYGGVLVFTIGLLNIFISVISEAYMLEKEKVHLTFARERASGNLTFLLRASLLPAELLSPRGTIAAWAATLLTGFAVQGLGFAGYYHNAVAVPVFVMVLIAVHVCVFQEVDAPWPTLNKPPSLRYIWLALPENVEEGSADSQMDCIRAIVAKELKSVREEQKQILQELHELQGLVQRKPSLG
eukprot:TRINITY_DN1929_c0_g1_i1.p1 TRINITY_DN1929_c0_g1~~TRINITY_DN1929_c0_g1_i1.p1  ORF type:complete len:845 (-),score=117.24 TRINITY_DN1929_c0_g1_i1:112-2601(-)